MITCPGDTLRAPGAPFMVARNQWRLRPQSGICAEWVKALLSRCQTAPSFQAVRKTETGPSSLPDSGLIYCDGGKSVHFCDHFRQIIPIFSSNDRKTVLDYPPVSLRSPKSDRRLAKQFRNAAATPSLFFAGSDSVFPESVHTSRWWSERTSTCS